jgi:glutamyl-tRNA(Gln) amidotransferase subunit E
LSIKDLLKKRIQKEHWKIAAAELDKSLFQNVDFIKKDVKIFAVNLPEFAGLLSHFTQEDQCFYDEIATRLKVIACLEKPNMSSSEDLNPVFDEVVFKAVKKQLNSHTNDAQIIFWAPQDDIKTALETIEERCFMCFDGVPSETRKSFENGSTVFERVLPGADRMYPDTDSAPIPLENDYIEDLRKRIPETLHERYEQLIRWGIPEDCFSYIFTYNYFPFIRELINDLKLNPKFTGTLFGQRLKYLHGISEKIPFDIYKIKDLLQTVSDPDFAIELLGLMFEKPEVSIKELMDFYPQAQENEAQITARIMDLKSGFKPMRKDTNDSDLVNYIMGELRPLYLGKISMKTLFELIKT